MESILTLSTHPDFYTITMIFIIGISCRSLLYYLLNKYENNLAEKSQPLSSSFVNTRDVHAGVLFGSPMLSWITILIKRKDSPPDDEDHHHLLIRTVFESL